MERLPFFASTMTKRFQSTAIVQSCAATSFRRWNEHGTILSRSKQLYHPEWRCFSRDRADAAKEPAPGQTASMNVCFLEAGPFYDKKTDPATSAQLHTVL
jgi:hypothetical protein